MIIRTASRKDVPLLADIICRANEKIAQQFGLTRDNAPNHPSFCTRDWILSDFKRGELYFLYETAGRALGCVAYESAEKNLAYLNRLAVLPDFQGKGIGTKLMAHLFDHARSMGKTVISIGIIAANDRLKNWYETLGFTPLEIKKFEHLPFDVLFMTYHLEDVIRTERSGRDHTRGNLP